MSTIAEHPGWRDYRRRRGIFFGGLVVGPVVIGVLAIAQAGELALLGASVVLVLHVAVAFPLLEAFPCPACEEFWFGWPRVGHADPSLPGVLWYYWTQKQCTHCGLPKLMPPEGWDPTKLRD